MIVNGARIFKNTEAPKIYFYILITWIYSKVFFSHVYCKFDLNVAVLSILNLEYLTQ